MRKEAMKGIVAAVVLALAVVGCGTDSTKTVTVTKTVEAPQTQPVETAEPVETQSEPSTITQDEAEQVYRAYIGAVLSGDVEDACDLMTEEYQDGMVKAANAETSVDLKGEDCEAVTRKSGALLSAFVGNDAKVSFSGFEASGSMAAITAHVAGGNPERVEFKRQGDDVKLSGGG